MRAGWIRPSAMSLVSVRRAVSRRTPSKPDSTTASGVSSMMKSMPVVFSRVRMLRPSRPMMRPFMSSDGRLTTDTVVSATWLAAVGFAARLFLDLADELGHVVARLVLRLLEQHVLGLRRAEPRDALELDHGLVVGDLQPVGDALGLGVAVAQRLLATVLLRGARVDLLVALQQALLGLDYLFAPAAQLGLDLAAHLVHFLFRLEPSFLDDGLGLTLGVAQQLLGFALRPGQLARGEIAADQIPRDHAHCQPHQPHHDVHGNHHLSPIPSQVARHEKGRATRPASATLARARDTVLQLCQRPGVRTKIRSRNLPNLPQWTPGSMVSANGRRSAMRIAKQERE